MSYLSKSLFALALFPNLAIADDGTGNETCDSLIDDLPDCVLDADVLLPDLMTVVPQHMQIQNEHQLEMLRFSNGLANLGAGPWWLEPEFPNDTTGDSCQKAYQLITGPEHFVNRQIIPTDEEIPAPDGTFRHRCEKGNFDFHETHNHWHIDNVGEFKVCDETSFDADGATCEPATTPGGTQTLGIKYTFCLVDWYKLADNAPNSDPTRNFFACETGFQGVSPGWVDQYHQATAGQEVNITGLAAGNYVLVSTVNAGVLSGHGAFEEEDTGNNTSWMRFELTRHSNGNPKIENEVSSCEDAAYLAEVTAEVQEFADLYHQGDVAFAADLVGDMCGDKSTNK